jgi:Ni,Fe-hydrogenase III large subunit
MQLRARLKTEIQDGNRLGLLTASATSDGHELLTVIISQLGHSVRIINSPLPHDAVTYSSLTPDIPQAHWFEREIADMWGLRPIGHPRMKSLVMHDAYPDNFFPLAAGASLPTSRMRSRRVPYRFTVVQGNGVYEVPVGPVHAGVIEPGHFRFSCLGEVIENLEIRLGFVHRGVEEHLTQCSWQSARHVVEAASSDTSAGNAVAHAFAMESLCGVTVGESVRRLRAACVEIERIACHIGDLAGICADIGFGAGSSAFGVLRAAVLGIAELLTGSRFMTGFLAPFYQRGLPDAAVLTEAASRLTAVGLQLRVTLPLLMDNPGAIERMEGMGIMKPSLAREFGLVGPAARASGIDYDVRKALPTPEYECIEWRIATWNEGDVLARARVRAHELETSVRLAEALLTGISVVEQPLCITRLPANAMGIGIVEAWRGELIHLVQTDDTGRIARYKIKDPSFNNWTALAVSVRGRLLSDFPLCNKSFSLSYSGTDL